MGDIDGHLERHVTADYPRQRNCAAVKEHEPRWPTQPATIVPIRQFAIERQRESPKLITDLVVQLSHANPEQDSQIHILNRSGTIDTNHPIRDCSGRLRITHTIASHLSFAHSSDASIHLRAHEDI